VWLAGSYSNDTDFKVENSALKMRRIHENVVQNLQVTWAFSVLGTEL